MTVGGPDTGRMHRRNGAAGDGDGDIIKGVMLCRAVQTITFGYTPFLSSIAPETGQR